MRRSSKSEKELCWDKGISQKGQSIATGYSLPLFTSGAEQLGFSQIKVKLIKVRFDALAQNKIVNEY